MKKIYLSLCAITLSLFSLTSCSNDDNTQPIEQNHLLGKWDLKTISVKISADGEVVQEIEDQSVEGTMTMQFDFKSGNVVDYYFVGQEETTEGMGTYNRNGNSITITIDNEPATFTILLNDTNNLHLGMTEEEEYQGTLVKSESTLKFSKI